jgi:hypothetical protein
MGSCLSELHRRALTGAFEILVGPNSVELKSATLDITS